MIKTYKKVLKNGLTLLLVPDETKNTTYCELMIKFGGSIRSFMVDNKIYNISYGLAHLLEHNIVENSIYGNSIDHFNKYHTSFNAATTYNITSFYFETVYDFYNRLEEMISIVNKPLFTNKINTIKKPIYEEIKRKNDIYNYNYVKALNECIYNNNYINILGDISDVKNITNKELKFIHNVFYKPQNQILAISGNFNINKTIQIIEKLYKRNKNINYKILDSKEKYEVNIKEKTVVEPKINEQITISFKIPSKKFTKLEKIKLTYYLEFFLKYNFDDNSANFKEVTLKKYSLTSFNKVIDKVLDNMVILSINLMTKYFDEFKNIVFSSINKMYISPEYFELEKRITLINHIKNSNNINYIFDQYLTNYLSFNYNKVDSINFINSLNYDECIELLKRLDFSNYTIVKEVKK